MSQDKAVISADYKHAVSIGKLRLHYSETWGEDRASVYMSRWIAEWGEKGPTIRLHVIRRPDGDRCLHDHPWSFLSLVLWGGYTEETEAGERAVLPMTFNYRPLDFQHRIVRLHKRVAVTLVFASRQQRNWGFYTMNGWKPWQKFVDGTREMRALWCKDS